MDLNTGSCSSVFGIVFAINTVIHDARFSISSTLVFHVNVPPLKGDVTVFDGVFV